MKHVASILVLFGLAGLLLGGCASKDSSSRGSRYAKKLYITPEDYQEDIANAAEAERREAQPNYESDYLFNAYPQTDPNIYFFDRHQQPKMPGEYSEKDYKNEKRLWTKPRRYTPEEYYGLQGDSSNTTATEESGYYEQSEGY